MWYNIPYGVEVTTQLGCAKMSAYFIANIRINNAVEYQNYIERVDEVFSKFNDKYLKVDNSPVVLEGTWDYSRLVLIEFPDGDSLTKWYTSNKYQAILKHRLLAAECDTIMIE